MFSPYMIKDGEARVRLVYLALGDHEVSIDLRSEIRTSIPIARRSNRAFPLSAAIPKVWKDISLEDLATSSSITLG